mmetsp:Transcript_29888/g.45293  ORF Transcript_29888/g.45293 Transcript_29888/m.45293 type:complete len:220 (+) Transcript_29888:78-737(+)
MPESTKSKNQLQETEKAKPPAAEISIVDDDDDDTLFSQIGAQFRALAVVARAKLPALKLATKQAVRTVGQNRSLAFASEGAVAGQAIMPKWMYYGAWGLSGLAITGDITTRVWDAPKDKEWQTAGYWTAFHIPASLVVPAVIIHKVVHAAEDAMKKESLASKVPVRARPFVPVAAALLSIIPVVPTVDYSFECIMEPTLGKYLGLEFHHHHGEEKSKTE